MTAKTPANEENVRSISRITGADMSSGAEYRFCTVQADGTVVVSGANANALGVIRGKAGLGHAIEVGISGRMLVVLGGTVAAGAEVESDSSGAAVTKSSGPSLGISLTGGSAGDVSDVVFDRG